MTVERLLPWARLKAVPGVGDLLFRRLLLRFGDPESVFAAPRKAVLAVEGMTEKATDALFRQPVPGEASEAFRNALDRGIAVVTQNDPDYPRRLLDIPDPPPILYVLGSLKSDEAAVGVVGSRNATAYGLQTTARLCRELARCRVTVVSGMARGIDAAAHQGALDGGWRTIAVMGCGLDTIYPPEHEALFHRIRSGGAVISEFPLSAGPDAHHFPRRNRIISGLCLGVVVVEATRRSGSLITARMALEQGREVFAVPGSVHSFKSAGTHALIKEGARLVESVADILDELPMLADRRTRGTRPAHGKEDPPPLTPEETAVLDAIGGYDRQFDDLVRLLGMSAGRLSALLLNLELKGMVRQSAGRRYTAGQG